MVTDKDDKPNEQLVLTYETEFYFPIFGASKFCLALWLRQLICDIKCDVRTLKFGSDVTYSPPQKHRMKFGEGRYAMQNFKRKRMNEN